MILDSGVLFWATIYVPLAAMRLKSSYGQCSRSRYTVNDVSVMCDDMVAFSIDHVIMF